ncbi:MAG: CopG family transcriptional regulator [Pseudomonadota bacterium]
MKKKTKKEPMGKIKIIKDFLPTPDNLIFKDETIKVTLSLTKNSVDFFKQEAKKQNTKYQQMIRVLLDRYTSHFDQSRTHD